MAEAEDGAPLAVLELFCGIGGLRSGLAAALGGSAGFTVVKAIDLSPDAARTYTANYGDRVDQVNIATIGAQAFDSYEASLWLMSPPCQPYTVQGPQRDAADPRADALRHLTEVLGQMKRPPKMIFLENVAAFEQSESLKALLAALVSAGYAVEQFILSPIQFDIPNSRLRYYLLATLDSGGSGSVAATVRLLPDRCKPLADSSTSRTCASRTIAEFLDPDLVTADWLLPEKVVGKHSAVLDVITAQFQRSCCFTAGYSKRYKGAGSVLRTVAVTEAEEPAVASAIKAGVSAQYTESHANMQLRWLSPREVLNLHCFGPEFKFPANLSRKQQYKLIGNSINVRCVERLLCRLLEQQEDGTEADQPQRKRARTEQNAQPSNDTAEE